MHLCPGMQIPFAKWHGTGNDFILVDDREALFPVDEVSVVRHLCHRHFGIGSDGLILVRPPREEGTQFHMEFFNPDGSRSFCGNGSRCAFAFWSRLASQGAGARFTAIDGVHEGRWVGEEVAITLPDVRHMQRTTDGAAVDFIHTGSPHEVVWVEDVETVDILADGPLRRSAERHGPGGSNVNYVQVEGGGIRMRTFERGVEAETLSCGSGVVAAALSALLRGHATAPVAVRTRGGALRVEASADGQVFTQVRLIGPVQQVFTGHVQIPLP